MITLKHLTCVFLILVCYHTAAAQPPMQLITALKGLDKIVGALNKRLGIKSSTPDSTQPAEEEGVDITQGGFPNLKPVNPLEEAQPSLPVEAVVTAQRSSDMPKMIEEPRSRVCELPEVMLRVFWCDDVCTVTVNDHTFQIKWGQAGPVLDGKHDLSKTFASQPGDSGKVGINPWVKPGKNVFKLVVDDTTCCNASAYTDIWVDRVQKVKDRWVVQYGKPAKKVYEKEFEIELPECGGGTK